MGFLKKIVKKVAKGVKKVVKGVGKVVKKVAKGVAKGIDKLGIVGQIGMMFVMPYAMGALGPVWQSFGGFAKTMMGSSNLLYKGIGYAANGIFTAGNMIGSAYKSVTGVIDGAVKGIADTVGLGDAYTNSNRKYSTRFFNKR
jgi:phage-related protein